MPKQLKEKNNETSRAPVVVVAGHIDHGKSTLLDYIRKTKTTESEAGGITQHISAYEVSHTDSNGKVHKITFLDTPGHEAFCGVRERGVAAADIAILVVSVEDGVKPQTLEALNCIKSAGIPYIVAITKIDKTGANIEKIKQSLAENEIYVEGYGGDVPIVAISALTGEHMNELLDMIILVAEINEIKGDKTKHAEGIVVESLIEAKKGIAATIVIKNGTLKIGDYLVAADAWCPVRAIDSSTGEHLKEAVAGQPVRIIGWSKTPITGAPFRVVSSKSEAEEDALLQIKKADLGEIGTETDKSIKKIGVIIKTDTAGSAEAVIHEIQKNKVEGLCVQIISSGIGNINEGDIKRAGTVETPIIVGFNVKADARAKSLALRNKIQIATFDVIYRLTEFVTGEIQRHKPIIEMEQMEGKAKILKIFSTNKGKYVVGGRVEKGTLKTGDQIKLFRRENEVGRGKIRNLQQQKEKVDSVQSGAEFGAMIETSVEPITQDGIESFILK